MTDVSKLIESPEFYEQYTLDSAQELIATIMQEKNVSKAE